MWSKINALAVWWASLVWAEVLSWGWVSSAIWVTKDFVGDIISTYWPNVTEAISTQMPFSAAAAPFALAWVAAYKWVEKWKELWLVKWAWDGITKSWLIYGWVWTAASVVWAWALAPFSVPVLAWGLAMYGSKRLATDLILPWIKGTYYWIKWVGNKINPFSKA